MKKVALFIRFDSSAESTMRFSRVRVCSNQRSRSGFITVSSE